MKRIKPDILYDKINPVPITNQENDDNNRENDNNNQGNIERSKSVVSEEYDSSSKED